MSAGLACEAAYTAPTKLSALKTSMRNLDKIIAVGEPLMQLALEALQLYNEAKGVASDEEFERLRLEAEALMTAVSDYQLRVLGGPPRTLH